MKRKSIVCSLKKNSKIKKKFFNTLESESLGTSLKKVMASKFFIKIRENLTKKFNGHVIRNKEE